MIAKRGQITKHRADHLPFRQLIAPPNTGEFQPKFVPGLTQVDTLVKLVLGLEQIHQNVGLERQCWGDYNHVFVIARRSCH